MEITNPAHKHSNRLLHNTASDGSVMMEATAIFPRTSVSSLYQQQQNGESAQHGNPPANRPFPRFHYFDHHLQDSRSTMGGGGAASSGRRSAASGGSGWTIVSSSVNDSVEDRGQASINRINMNCFLCKSLFREPMILSCGHSFCRGCVERWLRKCTFCPMCRVPTLAPFRNVMLAEMIDEYKRIERGQASLFQRSVAQPLMRTFRRKRRVGATNNKEAKCIQRETLRASLRRPKEPKFSGDHPSTLQQTEKSVDGQPPKRPSRFAATNTIKIERNRNASSAAAHSLLCRTASNSGFGGDFCMTPWQRNVPTTTTRGATSSATSLPQCQRAMAACRLNEDEEMPEDPRPNCRSVDDEVESNVYDGKSSEIDYSAAGGFRRMTGLRKSFGRLKRRFGNATAVTFENVEKQTKCDHDASAIAAVELSRQPFSRLTALHTPSPSPETVLAEENKKKPVSELVVLETSFEADVTRSLSTADSCRGTTSLSANSFVGSLSTATQCSAKGMAELNPSSQFVLVVTALNGLVAADDDDHNDDAFNIGVKRKSEKNKKPIPPRLRQMISHAFAINYENVEFIDIGSEAALQSQTLEDMRQNNNAVSPTLAQLRRRNRPIHPAQQRNQQFNDSAVVVERKLLTALTAQRVSERNDTSATTITMTSTAVLVYCAQCAASFDAISRFFSRVGAMCTFAEVRFVLIAVHNIDYNFGQHHLQSPAAHRLKLSMPSPPVAVTRKCGEKLAATLGGRLFELNESELTSQRIKTLLSTQIGQPTATTSCNERQSGAKSSRRVVDDVTILPTALATASINAHSTSSGSSCSIM